MVLENNIKEITCEPGVSRVGKAGKSISSRRSRLNKGTRHGSSGKGGYQVRLDHGLCMEIRQSGRQSAKVLNVRPEQLDLNS